MNILTFTVVLIFRIGAVFGQSDGEQVAQPDVYPYVTTLGVEGNLRKCIGTILTKDWVLTTCKCGYKGEPLLVQHGGIQNANPDREHIAATSDVITHPKYAGTLQYCINLIRLSKPLKYDQFTQPVKLTPKEKKVSANSAAIAISWSPETNLLVFNSTVTDNVYTGIISASSNLTFDNKKVGTPLMQDGYQIGVLIYDTPDKLHYTDLTENMDWIYKTITFYEFQDEYSYLRNLEPNKCKPEIVSNKIEDVCCTYPFGYQFLDLCTSFE